MIEERMCKMGFTGMIGLIILAVFVILIYFVVTGIKQNDWKRIVFPIILFVVFVFGVYWAFVSFITSM